MSTKILTLAELSRGAFETAIAALSDSSRREMIRVLLQRPRRAGELAQCVDMSPQALSRHLRVLRKAGLVAEESIEDFVQTTLREVCAAPHA